HKNGKLVYNAASPDELALVNAARFFGVKFIDRDEENVVTIDFKGTDASGRKAPDTIGISRRSGRCEPPWITFTSILFDGAS
ncbi:MAG TPA: hypothetical protein VL132_10580, partial [Planctomycetaceae bacterium]|nr:hypothetical protein [Planctomycetaceae bacterium]